MERIGLIVFWAVSVGIVALAADVLVAGIAFLGEVLLARKLKSAATGGFLTMFVFLAGLVPVLIAIIGGGIWGASDSAAQVFQFYGFWGATGYVLAISAGLVAAAGLIGFIGYKVFPEPHELQH